MRKIDVLLVEDNPGDILLTTETFEESEIVNRVTIIKDGEEAINFFETLDNKTGTPQLIFLDINLPKMNGHEVLTYIKKHEKYKNIPVIMLSTSSAERDVLRAYKNSANGYMTKPISVSEFTRAITEIEDLLVSLGSIPPN
ncbi:MAG: response regulator [Mucilaginibacter sp.]